MLGADTVEGMGRGGWGVERDRRDERKGEEGIQVEAILSEPLFLVSCLINHVFLFYTMRCVSILRFLQ